MFTIICKIDEDRSNSTIRMQSKTGKEKEGEGEWKGEEKVYICVGEEIKKKGK